jgi:hypothetical protein
MITIRTLMQLGRYSYIESSGHATAPTCAVVTTLLRTFGELLRRKDEGFLVAPAEGELRVVVMKTGPASGYFSEFVETALVWLRSEVGEELRFEEIQPNEVL